jgi:hypothetical protein
VSCFVDESEKVWNQETLNSEFRWIYLFVMVGTKLWSSCLACYLRHFHDKMMGQLCDCYLVIDMYLLEILPVH